MSDGFSLINPILIFLISYSFHLIFRVTALCLKRQVIDQPEVENGAILEIDVFLHPLITEAKEDQAEVHLLIGFELDVTPAHGIAGPSLEMEVAGKTVAGEGGDVDASAFDVIPLVSRVSQAIGSIQSEKAQPGSEGVADLVIQLSVDGQQAGNAPAWGKSPVQIYKGLGQVTEEFLVVHDPESYAQRFAETLLIQGQAAQLPVIAVQSTKIGHKPGDQKNLNGPVLIDPLYQTRLQNKAVQADGVGQSIVEHGIVIDKVKGVGEIVVPNGRFGKNERNLEIDHSSIFSGFTRKPAFVGLRHSVLTGEGQQVNAFLGPYMEDRHQAEKEGGNDFHYSEFWVKNL